MESQECFEDSNLTESQVERIKAEVRQAADEHLHAKDAVTALSHYMDDVTAASNEKLYSSLEILAGDIKGYYRILKEVHLAAWDEIHIHVISAYASYVSARFRYSFTSTDNERTDMHGVWSALYIKKKDTWKIRAIHESFSTK
jgi:ketosteroid isomerase-like protein